MAKQKQPPQHQDTQPGDEHDMRPEPEFIRASYRGVDKLKDKVAIITGGDSGFGGQVPMDRAGQPSEMGPAYVYLACEESSYMTGQTLHLNGGVVLNT